MRLVPSLQLRHHQCTLPTRANQPVRRTVQGSVGRVDLVDESRMGCFGVQSLFEIQPNRNFGPVRPVRRLDQAADGEAQAQRKKSSKTKR